ncbi:MAG: helix-turn-helix domain-containing protein [Clostridium sp.]
MDKLFSIGEVSKLKGITIKALRYYHDQGILVPNHIDEESGYRYYSIEQFIYIDIIKACRTLGASIREIQEIFKNCNTEELMEFIGKKKNEALEKISEMNSVIENIDKLTKTVENSKKALENSEIIIKEFEDRPIVYVPCKRVGSLSEILYYSDLDRIIEENHFKVTANRGIHYGFDHEGNTIPMYAFSEIDGPVETWNHTRVLPGGSYIVMTYSKENQDERMEILRKYIEDNNYPKNSLIEIELLNDFFNVDTYSCEVQVPIY